MKPNRASNMDVRKANRNRIYRTIHANDGISKPEIAHRLQMSLPTVLQNVKTLLEQGLVMENGSLESTGGRKAVAMSSIRDARTAVGLDITRNHVVAVLVNMDGSVTKSVRTRLPFTTGNAYIEDVGAIVDAMLEDAAADRSRIAGAGISIPGVLTADNTALTTSHVLRTDNYHFDALNRRLGLPCLHINDANAAGVAEMWGADPDWHFVYISLSNSVGGALVWDGHPRFGDNQRCGEIGHMTIERGGLRCYCGKKGCLDAYCAATILSDRTRGDLASFFHHLESGDAKLKAVWDDYLDYLATAVNSLRMIFDYDVVIGGYVGAHMESHMNDLRTRAAQLNTFDESGAYIKACRHKTEASAVGAALLQIETFIDGI